MSFRQQIEGLAKVIDEIGDKTSVIDEIVFQTKLLSFNASVEAERAGEHGRGFSVVAQEVGSLAQMSGKAALEISQIVKESTNRVAQIAKENSMRVEKGDQIAEATRKQAESVSSGAGQVLEASSEQEKGISQIREAIESINGSTQKMAVIANQSSHSSHKLKKQAENLNAMIAELNSFIEGGGRTTQHAPKQAAEAASLSLVQDVHEDDDEMDHNVETIEPDQAQIVPLKKAVGAENFGMSNDNEDGWNKL